MIVTRLQPPGVQRDPVARARRATMLVASACGLVVGLALAWCFWPVEWERDARTDQSAGTDSSPISVPSTAKPLDLAAFEAPLWSAPPPIRTVAAATPATPPPPPPPLKLQLLGIFQVDKGDFASSFRALLYDPDQDKVVIVASGDSIAQRIVDSVDRHAVALRDASGVRTLALRGDQPSAGPESSTSTVPGVRR